MAFGNNSSKNEEKEIKEIINKNIASFSKTQRPFSQLLMLNGCPMRKVGTVGSKIRKQLLKEAKNGDLTADAVIPRSYELIGEYFDLDEVKTFDDLTIETDIINHENTKNRMEFIRKDGFGATLPYVTSGVRVGQAGGNSFGGATYISSNFGEGRTEWKNSRVFFEEQGLRIDETEQFIHYKQIDYIDYSQNSDRKGLLALKRNAITFIMKNGEQIIMRVVSGDLEPIKQCIEEDMNKLAVEDNNDEDILLKYFDMFEKGLITREEFELKKDKLLHSENNDDSHLKQENKTVYCSNCGTLIENDSNFCTNCGQKL